MAFSCQKLSQTWECAFKDRSFICLLAKLIRYFRMLKFSSTLVSKQVSHLYLP